MVVEIEGTLEQIAQLLESKSLADSEVRDIASWKAQVEPIARPFLERVRASLPDHHMRFYQAQRVGRKRQRFHSLMTKLQGLYLIVTIGFADEPEGELERSLAWGAYVWGPTSRLQANREHLLRLQPSNFALRTIDGVKASDFGGATVFLYKALSPEALRSRREQELVQEIATDLRELARAIEQEPLSQDALPVTPQREARLEIELSATTVSDWLRARYGLHFTPHQLATFVTALQAKGFVILSGLSGTGKTQLAVRIAELVTGLTPKVIPVRPDWRDSRSLLGYYNPITERYVSTDLLKQLLPDREAEEDERPVPGEIDFQRVRQAIKQERDEWVKRLRNLVERLERRDPSDLSEEELDEIWQQKRNGVTGLGQAGSHPLHGDSDVLRDATRHLTSAPSAGEALISVLHYLRDQGNPLHWARTLRALAVFKLDQVSAIVHRDALREVLRALGYSSVFRLDRAVHRQNARAIDEAFRFLRRKLDEHLPDLDRFEKAIAPWFVYQQFAGAEPSPDEETREILVRHRFIVLDEMNLARVEYYFAEFLSVLESDRDETGVTTQALPLHSEPGVVKDGRPDDQEANDIPGDLPLPPYLYVVGTVNTDETTHAFSPKVLDRAFTLEFNEVDLARFGGAERLDGAAFSRELAHLLTRTTPRESRQAVVRAIDDPRFLAWLQALYRRLSPYDLHFGYRVRDEIARFVGYALASPLADGFGDEAEDVFPNAFDSAVIMKVLPRFHGPRAKLATPLSLVVAWAINPEQPDEARVHVDAVMTRGDPADSQSFLLRDAPETPGTVLPRTAEKASRMLSEVITVGFTTFA